MAAGLPRTPGVYRFRDARGRVLHVGRATELRSRVSSYAGDLGDRVQAELRALAWVTATQRVTTMEEVNSAVHGLGRLRAPKCRTGREAG